MTKPKECYIVVRISPDVNPNLVEIKGVFSSKDDAEARSQILWFQYRLETHVETYMVDLIPGEN